MLAKNQKQRPARISVRYYLWSAEGLQRITQRLHRELFERDVVVPQFAGTKQKVLEVFVQRVTKMHYSISARGVRLSVRRRWGFWTSKTLPLEGSLKLVGSDRHRQTFLTLTFRLSDTVSRMQYTWKPSKTMLDDVWSDIEPRRAWRRRRLPLLRPFSSRGTTR